MRVIVAEPGGVVAMTNEGVSESIQTLLLDTLDSYDKLRIVRSLFVADGALELSELARACGLPSAETQEALDALCAAGVVVHDADPSRFVYARGDAARDADVAAVCAMLDDGAVEIAALLNAVAMERARRALESRLQHALESAGLATPRKPR